MTMEQKIDELLRIVKGHDERFSQIDARFERIDAQFEKVDARLNEQEERNEARHQMNNTRFEHLSHGIDGLRIEMREVKLGMTKMNDNLNAKIDHFHDSLSQDLEAFAGDLYKFEKRLPRPRKKSLS